jgi:hypothetical protein
MIKEETLGRQPFYYLNSGRDRYFSPLGRAFRESDAGAKAKVLWV